MRSFLRIFATTLMVSAVVIAIPTSATVSALPAPPPNKHCLVKVVDIDKDGNFVLSTPTCYNSFGEVLKASDSAVAKSKASSSTQRMLLDSIIGTHWDGSGGTGASTSVLGSDCAGGGLNVSWDWNDRISSTTNGCHRIVHYEHTNYAGFTGTTLNGGVTTNISGYMDNKTSSIKYFAS